MNQDYPLIKLCFLAAAQGYAFYADMLKIPHKGVLLTLMKTKSRASIASGTQQTSLKYFLRNSLLTYSFFSTLPFTSFFFPFSVLIPAFSSSFCSPSPDLFESLSELIILTASRCLHGVEIRSVLTESVAQLYTDLDGGFTHAAWLLPQWLPLPSFRYTPSCSSPLFINGLSWLRSVIQDLHCLVQIKQVRFRFLLFIYLCFISPLLQKGRVSPGYLVCKRRS